MAKMWLLKLFVHLKRAAAHFRDASSCIFSDGALDLHHAESFLLKISETFSRMVIYFA